MFPLPTFEQELEDVETLLASYAPSDSHLQELEESTEVTQEIDPSDSEGRAHVVNPIPEPPLTRESLMQRLDAHPSVLSLLLFDKYEHTWLLWDPDTLYDEVTSLYGGIHPVNLGKLAALQAAYTKSAAWDEWHYFLFTLQPLNDLLVDLKAYAPPTPLEVGITLNILRMVDDKAVFSDEVKAFMRSVLRYHQFLTCPKEFEEAGVDPPDLGFPLRMEEVEASRRHPPPEPTTMEEIYGARLHEYDLGMKEMRHRLQTQLRLVRRTP